MANAETKNSISTDSKKFVLPRGKIVDQPNFELQEEQEEQEVHKILESLGDDPLEKAIKEMSWLKEGEKQTVIKTGELLSKIGFMFFRTDGKSGFHFKNLAGKVLQIRSGNSKPQDTFIKNDIISMILDNFLDDLAFSKQIRKQINDVILVNSNTKIPLEELASYPNSLLEIKDYIKAYDLIPYKQYIEIKENLGSLVYEATKVKINYKNLSFGKCYDSNSDKLIIPQKYIRPFDAQYDQIKNIVCDLKNGTIILEKN